MITVLHVIHIDELYIIKQAMHSVVPESVSCYCLIENFPEVWPDFQLFSTGIISHISAPE